MGSPWDGVPLVQGLGHAVRPGADGAVGDRLPPLCPRAPWCEGFWGGVSPPVGQQAGEPWGHRTGVKSCTDPAPNLPGCLAAHHPASTPGGAPGAPYRSRCFHGKILGTPPPPGSAPLCHPLHCQPQHPGTNPGIFGGIAPRGGSLPCHPGKDQPAGCPPQKPPAPCSLRGGRGHTAKTFSIGTMGIWGLCFLLFSLPPPPPPSWSRVSVLIFPP